MLFKVAALLQACTNVNKCYCYPGWSGPDCSLAQSIPTPLPTTAEPEVVQTKSDSKLEKKETPYGKLCGFLRKFFFHNYQLYMCFYTCMYRG